MMNATNNTPLFQMSDGPGRLSLTSPEEIVLRIGQGVIGLLIIFSMLTNIVVIRVFLSSKYGKRTSAKILYANISLSDELFLLTCVLQATIYGNECNGNCRIALSYGTHISGFVSTYTMAFIAFKRYQAIAFPLQNLSQNSGRFSLFAGLGLIWGFATAMSLIFVRYVEVKQFDSSFFARICTIISSPVEASHNKPYFSLIVMVSIPLIIGLVFSLKAVHSLQSSKFIGESIIVEQLAVWKRQKLRSILMILVVIVTFAVCWLPITIFYTYERLQYNTRGFCDYNYYLYGLFSVLLMVEFGANPVIYWFMNQDFRKGLMSIWNRCFCCSKKK